MLRISVQGLCPTMHAHAWISAGFVAQAKRPGLYREDCNIDPCARTRWRQFNNNRRVAATHSLIPKENDGLGRSFRFKETKASTRRGDDQQEKQEQRG